ncbi:hypothetical protein HPG69_004027 [Diceros bicornis minor]|uniref:TIL domain-containing protein n=1 Tax=Diceros bicornis minor TaxID=77932 RepID=A0A7J7E9I4_DICBM|nr:hypothetical protein HPG69_004027 [Diceros bicornis minor]
MEDVPSGEGRLGGAALEEMLAIGVGMAPGSLETEEDKEDTEALCTAWPVRCCPGASCAGETTEVSVSGPACPAGMEYKECVSPCARTCQSLHINEVCQEKCVDGCSCPGNKLPTLFTDLRPCQCPWLGEAR